MKYCIKCGFKLSEDDKYCNKCGTPTRITIEKEEIRKKEKKENKKDKIISSLGIFLVIFASILFTFISWNNLDKLFRLLFICFESGLFLILSLLSKKMNNKISFRMCYALGVILIPIIMLLFNYYDYTSLYFKDGAGLFVYLSIISFVCFIISIISYKITKGSFYTLTSYLSTLLLVGFIFGIFNLLKSNYVMYYILFSLVTLIYNVLINKGFIFENKKGLVNLFITITTLFLIISLSVLTMYVSSIDKITTFYKVKLIICNILLTINLYVKELDKNTIIKYFTPIFVMGMFSMTFSFVITNSICYVIILLLSILIYLVSMYKNNEAIKTISLVILFITMFVIIGFTASMFKALVVNSLIILLFSSFMYKIEKTKSVKQLFSIVIPIGLYFFIYSLFRLVLNLNVCEILLISSVMFYSMYLILKNLKKDISNIFEVFYIIFIVISTLKIGDYSSFRIVIALNTIVWLFYYVSSIVVSKSGLKYPFLIGTLISLLVLSGFLHIEFFYTYLGVILILCLANELDKDKYNLYLIFSSILTIYTLHFDYSRYSSVSIILNALLFAYEYIKIKKLNIDIFRIIYTFFGFILIYKILNSIIEPDMIVGIITFFVYSFILVVMYLSECEKNRNILLYSFMILVPYGVIAQNLGMYDSIKNNVILLPCIIYTLVISEFIKTSNKKIKEVIILILILYFSMLCLSANIYGQGINIVLSIILLIYGLTKKYDLILYYGIIYLLLTLIISFSNLFNSLFIVLILLFIGIGLVIYTFIKETKK